ncbi:MAG: hypothetical protein Fur0021_08490 [Candidatus Promineifilaceae bacterium]
MIAPSIQDINTLHLLPPLRRLFGFQTVAQVHWQMEKMKGGIGNPVSMGLCRFYGHALVQDQMQPFSMVLKAIRSPAKVGLSNLGEGDDQTHWNYWQREAFFYQSDLISQVPAGITIPQCYGIHHWDDQIIWLWLEEIEHGQGDIQQPEQLGFLAYQLGRLNGKFADPARLPDAAWLARNTHAQWLKSTPRSAKALLTATGQPKWDHPYLQSLFPAAHSHPFRQFWDAIDHFLAILPALPSTWCHGDGAPTNFKIRQTSDDGQEVVALDWALTGIGVLGEDVAQLIGASYAFFDAGNWDNLIQMLLNRYLDGLREMGWPGDARLVWLGYAITTLIKYGTFLFLIIEFGLNADDEIPPATQQHKTAAQFLQQTAQLALELNYTGATHVSTV